MINSDPTGAIHYLVEKWASGAPVVRRSTGKAYPLIHLKYGE
ncbi:hypothetical protein FHX12_005785 [Rhizobium sp. BK609]|nr:hypothetical protein [Rhizobium sp. BK098]MBB3618763.1 hypothetical protein [Rhizobium sp. BK609]MBB3684203.1 hypothetical protein [Rhizobium sp. BK612]